MLKKWFARFVIPILAVVALCPLGAPQAFAEDHWFAIDANPTSGGEVYCAPIGTGWQIGAWLATGSYEVYATANPGWQFDGFWENGYEVGWDGASFYVDHDRWVTAYFSPIMHEVTFEANGGWGSQASMTVQEGSTFYLPYCTFTRDGWSFDSWSEGNPGDPIAMGSSDMVIEANWNPVIQNVIYDPNGGGGTTVYTSEQACSSFWLEDPDNLGFSAPAGCVFDGWSLWDGSSYSNGDPGDESYIGYYDVYVYAIWAPAPPVYHSVHFVSNGEGSGSMADLSVAEGDWFQVPECEFEPDWGREFDHWSFGTYPGEWLQMGTTDITLEAQYHDVTYYQVFINKMGASGWMEDPWIREGLTYTVPNSEYTPPEGTYFNGWYLEGVGTVWPGYTITMTKNIELKAQWEDILCYVYIMPNGGGGWVPDPQYKYGTIYELPECPFDAPWGMKFAGWDKGQPGDKIKLTESVTINAQWIEEKAEEPISYSFASGNGSSWKADSAAGPSFTIKRNRDDNETFGRFQSDGKVTVDGKDVPATGYAATAGSLKLTLAPEYLATLAPGTHALEIAFGDGSAKGSFTVAEASGGSGSAASPSGSSAAPSGSSASPDPSGNQKGGNSGSGEFPIIPVLLGIIAAALIAIFVLLLLKGRKKDDNGTGGSHSRQ